MNLRALGFFVLMISMAAGAANAAGYVPPAKDEFIGVAADDWTFEGKETGRRFVPWGANFVLRDKENLNNFGPRYAPERVEPILDACERLHINLLKVFLPIGQVLPDPQVPGEARVAPGYFDHLEGFLGCCQKRGIRVVVSLASWGGNGCQWWHDGGQYFGREPWKQDAGMDSITVLTDFWEQLATRFQDNPTIFSYTPAVEWTMPATNLTWFAPNGYSPNLPSEPGRWYWRAWLRAKYGTLERLNAAYGAVYGTFEEVPLVTYEYDRGAHAYVEPEAMVLDYSNFRDWTSLRYLRQQIAAIRTADPNHMVTISNHMRFWDLWEGGAQHFLGITPFEEKPYIDYMTVHANFHEDQSGPDRTDEDIVRTVMVLARFVASGKPMPVVLEEYTFTSATPSRVAEVQRAMVEGTVGHLSGWTTWYLQYPENPAAGADAKNPKVESSWLNYELEATPWGQTARGLFEMLTQRDLARIPPAETVALVRAKELLPKGNTTVKQHMLDPTVTANPVDYEMVHEPDLDIELISVAGSGLQPSLRD